MSYYTGTASSYANLQSQIVDALETDGWTIGSEGDWATLARDGRQIDVQTVVPVSPTTTNEQGVRFRGDIGGAKSPSIVRLGRLSTTPEAQPVWPVTWEVYAWPTEVWIVVEHDLGRNWWVGWGWGVLSNLWVAGQALVGRSNQAGFLSFGNNLNGNSSGSQAAVGIPFMVFETSSSSPGNQVLTFSYRDDRAWSSAQTGSSTNNRLSGPWLYSALVQRSKNAWNDHTVLIPARAYRRALESKWELEVESRYLRLCRIDNYERGDIITLGDDRWRLYPGYVKNAGVPLPTGSASHSGCYAFALKYEGP